MKIDFRNFAFICVFGWLSYGLTYGKGELLLLEEVPGTPDKLVSSWLFDALEEEIEARQGIQRVPEEMSERLRVEMLLEPELTAEHAAMLAQVSNAGAVAALGLKPMGLEMHRPWWMPWSAVLVFKSEARFRLWRREQSLFSGPLHTQSSQWIPWAWRPVRLSAIDPVLRHGHMRSHTLDLARQAANIVGDGLRSGSDQDRSIAEKEIVPAPKMQPEMPKAEAKVVADEKGVDAGVSP